MKIGKILKAKIDKKMKITKKKQNGFKNIWENAQPYS
jgi:hypothetical protein